MFCGFVSYSPQRFWAWPPHTRIGLSGREYEGEEGVSHTLASAVLALHGLTEKGRPAEGAGGCCYVRL